jgi:inorganic pyrophosphatase
LQSAVAHLDNVNKMATRTKTRGRTQLDRIRPFASKTTVNVIVETPKGRRSKFRFDEKSGLFTLGKVLPLGHTFPYDFGFVPGTKAEDGDPIDVLVLMDEAAYPGCLVTARLIGVLEAEEVQDGQRIRNDRLIAVAEASHDNKDIRSLRDLDDGLRRELEHFFESYNALTGKQFRLLRARGPRRAKRLLKRALSR